MFFISCMEDNSLKPLKVYIKVDSPMQMQQTYVGL